MASEHTIPDDGPVPDAFEAELVAYLDGELDPVAARQIEARLAKDSNARARATELKKSFDLLDYLPRPEPSPTFTSRTIDKLPALNAVAPPATPAPRGSQGSSSVPVPLEQSGAPVRRAGSLRVVGLCAAVVSCAVVGYFATAAARTHLFSREKESDEAKVEVDARVAERLPLYAAADDIAFVVELAKPDLFGDNPAVTWDVTLKVPSVDVADRPIGKEFDALVKTFRALPSARQAEIVKLDQDLHAKEPRERDRLFRALEVYAVWLDRLPEPDRRAVLTATPGARLGAVRDVRDRQWLDTLPPAVRAKPELVEQWREDEAARRDRLAFLRQHSEAFAASKSPWPFDTENGRKDVLDFARAVLKPDDQRRCRLSFEELTEYRRTLQVAQQDDVWAWFGLTVYELARKHPSLPEPENGRHLVVDLSDLPEVYVKSFIKKGSPTWRVKPSSIGRWPEFALEINEQPLTKSLTNPPALGPARYTDFKKPVQEFATKELLPKLTDDEHAALDKLAGKWPEYPRLFLEYAKKYDLSVPGVTLPGAPSKWDATYGTRPAR